MKPRRAPAKKAPPAEPTQELARYERWVRMLDGQIRVLERERQKLSAVVNHADAGFLVFDRNLRVIWANDGAAGEKSPSPANPMGKLCHEVLCRRDARCEECPAAVPFATRVVAHLEMSQPKDGTTRSLYTTAMPVLSPMGDVDQVMVMVQDISDLTVLRRSEAMLKESEARKDAVLRTALDAVVGMSHDGLVTEFNPTAEAMFGYRRDEVMGKPLTEIIIPERLRDAHAQGLKRAGSRGDSQVIGQRVEMPALRRDGTEFPVELAITRVAVEGAPAYTGYIRDLTERKNAEARLRQSEDNLRQAHKMEAIGTLAGGVAHDFNNILTAILGYTALLKRGVGDDQDLTHAVDVIEKASQRGADLTRQLLGFARKGKNQTIAVDLEATIGEVLELLNRTIDKSIRIVHIPSPVRSFVTGDPGQLEQVILNLAVNARDAMPGGGELAFAVEPKTLDADTCRRYPGTSPGPHVRLSIADSGCGIPEEAMSRIFEPFFTTKEQGQGTGMGLAMVYGIVQNHGGGVHVESTLGRGTRVEIVLPRGEEAPAAVSAFADSSVRGSGRILVVDDEEAVRDVTADLLRELGYHVSTAYDGLDAVEFYARHAEQIDLIILDLVMPRMGGRECYRALKELNPDVRAVLCTGYGFNIAAQELLDEGMLDFISKPFEAGRLSSVVSRSLPASSKARA